MAELRQRVEACESELLSRMRDLPELEVELKALRESVAKMATMSADLGIQLSELDASIARAPEGVGEREAHVDKQDESLEATEVEFNDVVRDLRRREDEIDALSRWIGRIYEDFEAHHYHWWWQFGLRLRGIAGSLGVKSLWPSQPFDHATAVIEAFRDWERGRADRPDSTAVAATPDTRDNRDTRDGGENRALRDKSLAKEDDTAIESGPSFQIPTPRPSVEIVVCVHNALTEVKACLESVVANTEGPFRMVLVNDGSNGATTDFLRNFSRDCGSSELVENQGARGYTFAANQGLKTSTADYVILLNSDTIVSKWWLDRILECGESSAAIGIVGPLSNAASFQSLPECKLPNGEFSRNPLPDTMTIEAMARAVARLSARRYPRVPLLNGFCFAIKRFVIEAIGYLDAETFPQGYGEENDYCLRALDAGIELSIADHAYVYHAEARSFGYKKRRRLSRKGSMALAKKHGMRRIEKCLFLMEDEPTLLAMRQGLRQYLDEQTGASK